MIHLVGVVLLGSLRGPYEPGELHIAYSRWRHVELLISCLEVYNTIDYSVLSLKVAHP